MVPNDDPPADAAENDHRPALSERDLKFETSRSSGPGGQNVNKVETRVVACLDIEAASSLTTEEKERLRTVLAPRLTRAGVLRVGSGKHRSQLANRREAVARLFEIVRRSLETPAPRKRTRPGRGAHAARLEEKRRRARVKQLRQLPEPD